MVAFEWFLYDPEGDFPTKKKSPKSDRVSSQYQQVKCFCRSFRFEENPHHLTDGGVLLNLSGLEIKGVMAQASANAKASVRIAGSHPNRHTGTRKGEGTTIMKDQLKDFRDMSTNNPSVRL